MANRNKDSFDDPRRSAGVPMGTGSTSDIAEKIRKEVERLARKGVPTTADIVELYDRYPDNETIVDEILKVHTKRHRRIKEQARKIADKVYRKYNEGRYTLHQILDKMMKYKADNKWTDAEYDEFRKELSNRLTGRRSSEIDNNQNIEINRSRINRVLGNSRKIQSDSGLRIKESEHGVLSEILNMYERSSSLHRSVFMHSLMYTDCSLVAMTGEYKRERNISSNYIHPLLACMFLPKFDIFEIHMLQSNFGSIIKARYEKKMPTSMPDMLLYDDMTTDPNDVVCEINSPLADIRNRYKVQIKLWETVMKLRNGSYYEDNPISDFMSALNECRNNLYDNSDLVYNNDEGSMARRLFSVFSLRPTWIASKNISSLGPMLASQMLLPVNPGQGFNNVYPFQEQPMVTITKVPMITIGELPPLKEGSEPIDIRSAITRNIWLNEKNTMIPKEQSIIYSNEVLVFYVNRRVSNIRMNTFTNPLPFSQLPMTMSGFDRINNYPINVPSAITLGRMEETYNLRSVVAVSQTEISQGERSTNIITGSTGLITSPRDFDSGVYEPKYYLYDPVGAAIPVRHPESEEPGYFTNKPISFIEPIFTPPKETTGGVLNLSFYDRAATSGTIYIYAKPSGYQTDNVRINF